MPVLTKEMVPTVVATGASARRDVEVSANFSAGDIVRVKNINPVTHTRLPRYTRGRIGTVELDQGVFPTPETSAHGKGEHPQHVYNVSFSARELWGDEASPRDKVYVDLWDDHLEKVTK
ncbi:SH3-like domain-containing protein [Paraburkholderia mimosarum]|uniref:SH3-like domain-containing protein n=1 Tax=Paraburkholderia mimosarum TaxID=312026 RepID=UPI0039C1016B